LLIIPWLLRHLLRDILVYSHHVIMGYNPFLPIAGARVNVLCIPAGPITPDRFQKFVKALQNAARIERKIVDSTPSSGLIFFDVSANQDKWRPRLFPFEPNSSCQILLGLVDGARLLAASAARSPETETPENDILETVESIKAQFEEQHLSEPGLAVRRLIYCGTKINAPLGGDVLSLPDVDGDEAAREVMITISRLLLEGLTGIVNDLKDQPISMVPGATGSQNSRRTATTPVPASGSSTPVSTKPSSPMPGANGAEQQVCVRPHKMSPEVTSSLERYLSRTIQHYSGHVPCAMRILDRCNGLPRRRSFNCAKRTRPSMACKSPRVPFELHGPFVLV
jgi:hypothetical protein